MDLTQSCRDGLSAPTRLQVRLRSLKGDVLLIEHQSQQFCSALSSRAQMSVYVSDEPLTEKHDQVCRLSLPVRAASTTSHLAWSSVNRWSPDVRVAHSLGVA